MTKTQSKTPETGLLIQAMNVNTRSLPHWTYQNTGHESLHWTLITAFLWGNSALTSSDPWRRCWYMPPHTFVVSGLCYEIWPPPVSGGLCGLGDMVWSRYMLDTLLKAEFFHIYVEFFLCWVLKLQMGSEHSKMMRLPHLASDNWFPVQGALSCSHCNSFPP